MMFFPRRGNVGTQGWPFNVSLSKIRSYRISFDNQQNGMPLLFVKVLGSAWGVKSADGTAAAALIGAGRVVASHDPSSQRHAGSIRTPFQQGRCGSHRVGGSAARERLHGHLR
jgi:hypothetical protein